MIKKIHFNIFLNFVFLCVFSGEVADNQQYQLRGTSFTCDKCQEQFADSDLLTDHQKDCLKPVMLLLKENQENLENQSDPCQLNGYNMQAPSDTEDLAEDSGLVSNNFVKSDQENELDAQEENIDDEEIIDTLDEEMNTSVDERDGDEEEEISNLKESELSEKIKSNPTAADLKAYMQHLSNMLPTIASPHNSSNVLLEPLEATKAAVAQFAENNPDQEKDVSKLHAALFNLQQQQLMQLQLIQQLQQHLVTAGGPNGQFPLLNGQGFPGLNLTGLRGPHNINAISSKSSSRNESPSPKPESPVLSEKSKPSSSRSPSPSRLEQPSPLASSVANHGEIQESPVSLLMSAANKVGSTPSSSPSGLLTFSRSGSKG